MLLCYFNLNTSQWSNLTIDQYYDLLFFSCFDDSGLQNSQLGYYFLYYGFSQEYANEWLIDTTKSHALRIYSKFLPVDEYSNPYDPYDEYGSELVLPHGESYQLNLNNFENTILNNTILIPNEYGGEKITLDTPDRIANIVIDNSGSMSWNDKNSDRYGIIKRLVNRLYNTYPGNSLTPQDEKILYNLFTFGGKKVNLFFSGQAIDTDAYSTPIPDNIFVNQQNNISGIRIVRKTGSYPVHPSDGDIIFDGMANKFLDDSLVDGTQYYYMIYTYDSTRRYSSGYPFTITARNPILPKGIPSFNYEVKKGSGVVINNNTEGSWIFNEAEGSVVYDFTANTNLDITDVNPIWVSPEELTVGKSALRFDGNNTSVSSSLTNKLALTDKKTIMAWINPYSTSINMPIIARQDGINTNYVLSLNSNGGLTFTIDGVNFVSSSNFVLTPDYQSHIACTVDLLSLNVTFFVNGANVGNATLPSGTTSSGSMNFDIGYDRNLSNYFWGEINYVSIHNEILSDSDITNYSDSTIDKYIDNGERLVFLTYFVPSDYDYNNVQIILNKDHIPYSEVDGTVIYNIPIATSGSFITTYYQKFILGDSYNFRIFTQNALNNFSNIFTSTNLSIIIPLLDDSVKDSVVEVDSTLYPPLSIKNLISLSNKIYIEWEPVTSIDYPTAAGIQLYSSTSDYPVGNNNCFSGNLIFSGNISSTKFNNINLTNDINYYYTLVVVDSLNRIIKLINFSAMPTASAAQNMTLIPLTDIEGISYERLSTTHLNLFWNNLFCNTNIKGFLDQDLIFEAKLTDDYGNILSENLQTSHSINLTFDYVDNVETIDIFGIGPTINNTVDPNTLYQFTSENIRDGISRGILKITDNISLLRNIKAINIDLVLKVTIPNPDGTGNLFEYNSDTIHISLLNPLSFEITNHNNSIITQKCKSAIQNNSITETIKEYNGIYIGSYNPYVARIYINYKNSSLNAYGFRFAIYNATKNLCDDLDPVQADINNQINPSITYSSNGETEDILDANGVPTGSTQTVSYIDISTPATTIDNKFILYIYITRGGYDIIKKMFIIFKSPLITELNANIPNSDAIQSIEQNAMIYLLDPNDPTNISKRQNIPDGTLVQWFLTPLNNATTRYLLSTNNLCNGVCSQTTNSVAKDVFMAPVQNPKIISYDSSGQPVFEQYIISAQCVYDDYVSEDSLQFSFLPNSLSSANSGSYFLMEFEPSEQKFVPSNDPVKQKIFTDGISYSKMTITHDPSTSTTQSSDCFRNCLTSLGKQLVTLQQGQLVFINTNDSNIEIIWGDVIEILDPYLNLWTLDTTNANISNGSAYIQLSSSDKTYVYFRTNKDYSDQKTTSFKLINNTCNCLNNIYSENYLYEIPVIGSTISIVDGKIISLKGGGPTSVSDSIPPVILIPIDSLDIDVVDKRVNNQSIESLVIDDISINEIYLDVSLAGFPVPYNTPITIEIINYGEDIVQVESTTIYTFLDIDPLIDPNNIRAYAIIQIKPLPKSKTFNAKILVTATYTHSDATSKNRTICLELSHDSEDTLISGSPTTFSNEVFNSNLSTFPALTWNTKTSLNKSRGHLISASVNNKIYAIGGINGKQVLDTVEEYDPSLDTWTIKSPMSTPRMMAQSITFNNKIYIFGGITYNNSKKAFEVSRSVEIYDPTFDVWTSLTSMPLINTGSPQYASYGIAAGTAQFYNNKIYILSGIKQISDDCLSVDYNDRILIYDIISDSWTYSDTISDLQENIIHYKRIFPISLIQSDNIIIFSGSYYNNNENSYATKTYLYNITTEEISYADEYFSHIPVSKYKSAYITYNNYCFVIGGSNNSSEGLSSCENINILATPFIYNIMADIPEGLNGSSLSVINYLGNDYLFIIGGMTSARNNNFLQIELEPLQKNFDLNGKQDDGIIVKLIRDNGEYPSGSIEVEMKAYVQFSTTNDDNIYIIKDDLIKDVVLFENNTITTTNGIGYARLLPRLDDQIDALISDLVITNNIETLRYKIVIQAKIIDPTYFGQNFITTTSEIPDIPIITTACWDLNDNVLFRSESYNEISKLLSTKLDQLPVKSIDCYITTPWIPYYEKVNNELLTAPQTLIALDDLTIEEIYGGSPLYDCLNLVINEMLKNEYYQTNKIIYAMTDNESNSSHYSLSETINNINNIDGYQKVHLLTGNLSIYTPSLLSIYNKETESDNLNKLCSDTGGQSISITNTNYSDDTVYMLTGGAIGSIGYGNATINIDLNEISKINGMSLFFDLFTNTNARWKIYFSNDGFEYNEYKQEFASETIMSFKDINARYIKVFVELMTGFSISNNIINEVIPTTGLPDLTNIYIIYIPERVDYIYSNEIELDNSAKQVVIAQNNNIELSDNSPIEVGVSTTNTHNWIDFANHNQISRKNNGKIIIPIRNGQIGVDNIRVEPLINIDGFMFKTTYENWGVESTITIIDKDTNITIDSSEYKLNPRKGIVIFNSKRNDVNYQIIIHNLNKIKLGIKVSNNKENDFIKLYGISYQYSD